MYSGDIWIDMNGNTIIEDNDIAVTRDDRSFCVNMLNTERLSWRSYPSLGIGLNEFIGEPNKQQTLDKLKRKIEEFFNSVGLMAGCNIFPYDDTSAACYILFLGPFGEQFNLTVTFNLDSGNLNVVEEYSDNTKVKGTPVPKSYKNKYVKRGKI